MLQNAELDEQVTRADYGRHRAIPREKFRTALRTPAKRSASRRTYSTPIRELLIRRTKGRIPHDEPTTGCDCRPGRRSSNNLEQSFHYDYLNALGKGVGKI